MIKNILTNYRYYVLGVFAFIAFFCIFCTPDDSLNDFNWAFAFVASKAVGVGVACIFVKLHTKWESEGKLPELTNFDKHEEI